MMLKKIVLTLAIFVPGVALAAPAAVPASLVGTWRSDDTSAGSSKGTMVLKSDGVIEEQPDGFPVSSGHVAVHGAFLDIDLGAQMGKASVAYHLENNGKVLAAQYSDGTRQKFNKVEKK